LNHELIFHLLLFLGYFRQLLIDVALTGTFHLILEQIAMRSNIFQLERQLFLSSHCLFFLFDNLLDLSFFLDIVSEHLRTALQQLGEVLLIVRVQIMLVKHGFESHFDLILMVIFCVAEQLEFHFEVGLLALELDLGQVDTLRKLQLF